MRCFFRLLLIGAILSGLFSGCKKSPVTDRVETPDWIRRARAWFDSHPAVAGPEVVNPRTSAAKTPDWVHATVLDLPERPVIVVPLRYKKPFFLLTPAGGPLLYQIDAISHLVLFKDSSDAFHAELVTALPDSSYSAASGTPFTGLILVDRWNGDPIARFQADGKNVRTFIPGQEPRTAVTGIVTQTCYEIVGYNYSPDDPENGESWVEGAGCSTSYYLGTASSKIGLAAVSYLSVSGGGGSRPPSPAANFTVVSGNSPITDVAAYIKCFQNNASSKYTITLAVEQPISGSRAPIYFPPRQLDPTYSIGHTFLMFQQTTSAGMITIRSMGFYPKASVNPLSPSGLGMLNNDEGHWSNISMSFSVTGGQFMNIVNRAANGNSENYNLNSFNCTTWALACLSAGGVNINTKPGDWGVGHGDDPGDLGEDLRSLPLASYMYRNETPGNASKNAGTCP